MSRRWEIIEELKAGKKIDQKKCPVCGNSLRVIINGYLSEEMAVFFRQHRDYIKSGGCMIFADDRDPFYVCSKCGSEFTEDLEQIKLISCPLEAGGVIHEKECRDYGLLESRRNYELMDDRELICNKICPLMNKMARIKKKDGSVVEGKIMRTFLRTYDMPGNQLIICEKKDKYYGDFVHILISDISEIQPV